MEHAQYAKAGRGRAGKCACFVALSQWRTISTCLGTPRRSMLPNLTCMQAKQMPRTHTTRLDYTMRGQPSPLTCSRNSSASCSSAPCAVLKDRYRFLQDVSRARA